MKLQTPGLEGMTEPAQPATWAAPPVAVQAVQQMRSPPGSDVLNQAHLQKPAGVERPLPLIL